jgi:tetratricopeptide (TPR) repeat protein
LTENKENEKIRHKLTPGERLVNFFGIKIARDLFFAILGIVATIVVGFFYGLIFNPSKDDGNVSTSQIAVDEFAKGSELMRENKWDEAISELRTKMKNTKAVNLTQFCNLIGLCYYASAEPDSSIENYELSLGIAKLFDDKKGEVAALKNLSIVYKSKDDLNKAFEYLQKASKIERKIVQKGEIK